MILTVDAGPAVESDHVELDHVTTEMVYVQENPVSRIKYGELFPGSSCHLGHFADLVNFPGIRLFRR